MIFKSFKTLRKGEKNENPRRSEPYDCQYNNPSYP